MDIHRHSLTTFILFASLQHVTRSSPVAPSTCNLRLSKSSTHLTSHGNYSVLCDASCFNKDGHDGSLMWYDNKFNQVASTGRIFAVSYSRGRYSRLVIMNAVPTDAGNYICFLGISEQVKQKTFTLNIDGVKTPEERANIDEGPRRGDVVVYDPLLPRRRPRRQLLESTTEDDMSSGSVMDTSEATAEPKPVRTPEQTTKPELTPESTANYQRSTKPGPVTQPELTSKIPPITKVMPTTKPERTPTTKPEPIPTTKSGPAPATNPISEPQPRPTAEPVTAIVTMSSGPNTEFGRIGLVSFVFTLSIAFLLLYAIMLILCIPRCLEKRRASKRKQSSKKKEPPPELELQKVQGNGLPSPGPSDDAGFTTIDLDAAENQQQEQQQGKEIVSSLEADVVGSTSTDPNDSLISSVLVAFDEEKPGLKPSTEPPDLAFIDETKESSDKNQDEPTPVPINATPEVVDEPPRPLTETTEIKLDITEKSDGQKQITISTSTSPPPSPNSSIASD